MDTTHVYVEVIHQQLHVMRYDWTQTMFNAQGELHALHRKPNICLMPQCHELKCGGG